jgi:RecB family exonuclease
MATRKVIPIKPLTSWSFSRYNDYKKCPFLFKCKHLQGIKEPPNQAMERGTAIHTMAEDYTKGKLPKLPAELGNFSDEFKELRKMYKGNRNSMIVEDNWAFKADWSETVWNDWGGCWLRVKMDAAFTISDVLHIIDHKTGKNRDYKNAEYLEQCELYAAVGLHRNPLVVEARPRLWYLDEGTLYPEDNDTLVYTQEDKPRLLKLWEKRVKPMFNDKTFRATPNNDCKWCHYRKDNAANGGGQCKY